MQPICSIEQIINTEKSLTEKHVIILLLIKPSDSNADSYLGLLGYLKARMDGYCTVYLPGYSCPAEETHDAVIMGPDNCEWSFSNVAFVKFCDELNSRIAKWDYSGEPEMIIFQCGIDGKLDFSFYNYIEIDYGIEKEYIDSFPRFMERLYKACRSEVTAKAAVGKATRLQPKSIIEQTLDADTKLPKPIKKIIKDRAFYRTYNSK